MDTQRRPFLAKSPRPTPQAVAKALAGAAPCYEELMSATASLRRAWNHSKTSGWMLKTHDGKKALFYLVPLEGAFQITMTVRPEERVALLGDARLASAHAQLSAAEKYSEGHALRFVVGDRRSFRAFMTVLGGSIALRKP